MFHVFSPSTITFYILYRDNQTSILSFSINKHYQKNMIYLYIVFFIVTFFVIKIYNSFVSLLFSISNILSEIT